jgi:hypothetical protein
MKDGKISGNSAPLGGGVHVSGTFTMETGEISGNTAEYYGGGVHLNPGTFTMKGGEISGNTVTNDSTNGACYGGGVSVSSGTFTMEGGVISGNTVDTTTYLFGGGGVHLSSSTTPANNAVFFYLVTGTIYGLDADESLKNTINSNEEYSTQESAALYKGANAVAQRGKIVADEWESKADLTTTNDTIDVEDGEIVP